MYRVVYKAKIEGTEKYISLNYCNAKIESSLRDMITALTGIEWKFGSNVGYCKCVIPHISRGLTELAQHEKKFTQYDVYGGFGIGKTKRFFAEIIGSWEMLERQCPEISQVASFWIE